MKLQRGQTTAEFMAIFGIAIALFLVMFSISKGQNETMSAQRVELQGALAVADLANAAREVHAQGVGASRIVQITLPTDYIYSQSGIFSHMIRLHLEESDYIKTTTFDVQGSLPNASGTYQMYVSNQGYSIFIGTQQPTLLVNRSAISGIIMQGSTYTEPVQIANNESFPAQFTATADWPAGETSVVLSPASGIIDTEGTSSIAISVVSTAAALGSYSGTVNISTIGENPVRYVVVPVWVEVMR